MKSETFTNRLIDEKSPYLLQHAHNPVNWYPWGEEAFAKAKAEEKPIFLSIGYSTCHWCHVMEEESFENGPIAKIMNEHFISIKVDREERPDVDQVYMQAVMAMTGRGGWPMSVFLTPDRKPFYGGTYFPPDDRYGQPGFITVLNTLANKWKTERSSMKEAGEDIVKMLKEKAQQNIGKKTLLNEETLQKGFEQFQSQFDSVHGGFGDAPKFPRSHSLSLLLGYENRKKDSQALAMVEKTLKEMARGGMFDHLGGGFHRYSTDAEWHVPHFEKMLYDQALLTRTYLEAYQMTNNSDFSRVTREVFDYVLREMTHPQGGFYSAEDADSAGDASKPTEKSEGAFFIWEEGEIFEALGREDGSIFNYHYDIRKNGNATQDPHGEFTNKNILRVVHTLAETSKKFNQSTEAIDSVLKQAREKLFEVRAKRLRPHLDDKVLTDWNGLMISSLAFGAKVLGDPRYQQAAQKSADFILQTMKTKEGRLMHRWRDGEVAISGFIEDYAFFTLGLVDLYQATFEAKYLKEAHFFAKEMIRLFWDKEGGGFHFVGDDASQLITQVKEIYDGAIPSGNSVAVLALLKVGRLTMDKELEAKARELFETFSAQLANFPSGFPQMLIAFDFQLGPSQEIVLAGDEASAEIQKMIEVIFKEFIPNKVLAFHSTDAKKSAQIRLLIPFLENQVALGDKPTAYVCKNYVCKLPVTSAKQLEGILSA